MAEVSNCRTERNRGTLFNKRTRSACRLGCNRWTCATCGPRKANQAQKRLRAVPWTKLITITMPPGHGWAKRENLRYQARHLRSFWTALRRRYGAFRYAWVREVGAERADCICLKTARPVRLEEPVGEVVELLDCICGAGGGRLHLHILVDVAPWIDSRWLQAMSHRCGFGWVDIRAIRGSLVSYVSKYLSKGWAMPFPPKTRRIQTSGVDRLAPSPGWAFSWYSIQLTVAMQFDGLYCGPVDYWHDSG